MREAVSGFGSESGLTHAHKDVMSWTADAGGEK